VVLELEGSEFLYSAGEYNAEPPTIPPIHGFFPEEAWAGVAKTIRKNDETPSRNPVHPVEGHSNQITIQGYRSSI
jgi:hypothetical protein